MRALVAWLRARTRCRAFSDPRDLAEAVGFRPTPDRRIATVVVDGERLRYGSRVPVRLRGSLIYSLVAERVWPEIASAAADELMVPHDCWETLHVLWRIQRHATMADLERIVSERNGSGVYDLDEPVPASQR